MRTSTPILLFAALLFTSALPTYSHRKLLVTEEVLIEYVDHRLEQLEGKEKLDEEQAAELNFIRENRDNLQALADFYEMRIKEKESVRISEREGPPAREIQRESEKAVTVESERQRRSIEATPTMISEPQGKPPGFTPDAQVGEVRRTAEAEKTIAPKEVKVEERALSPTETSLPPVKPETAIASSKPLPQPNQMSKTNQINGINQINRIDRIDEINQRDQTSQTDQIDQPSQIAQLKPPPPITEQEVRQFVGHYRKRYIQRDINGFLSLFSYRAVQNGRDGFNEIGKIYSDFFDQSQELQYELNTTEIQVFQDVLISGLFFENAAIAQARYKLDQIVKENGKKKNWTGDVRWILVRENGPLKILHLDFKPE